MEISIKWNICRICLQEERSENPCMKPIFHETLLVKQITECAGIELSSNDGLPEKICRKCLLTLKYAVSFRKTCRKSDEYLRSVMQKAKDATILYPSDNSIAVEEVDDVIEDVYDGKDEYVYVISNIDEEKINETQKPDKMDNYKKTKSVEDGQVIKRAKYNLIDLTKIDDVTTRNDNCYSVEIMPADTLTTISVEEDEEEVEEIALPEIIETENKSDVKKIFEEHAENNEQSYEEFFTDNEVYTVHETQEDADKPQDEDNKNYAYIKVRISNDSDGEYILDEDELEEDSETVNSSEEGETKRKVTNYNKTINSTKTGLDKRIISTKKEDDLTSRVCDHCGNTFASSYTLKMHIRNLHKERPLECELCGKRFASPSNLSAHMRIHTGERRYECQFCHRRFTDRSTHIKHERSIIIY